MSNYTIRQPTAALLTPHVEDEAEECPEFLTGGREQQTVQFCRKPVLHADQHLASDGTTWPNRSAQPGPAITYTPGAGACAR